MSLIDSISQAIATMEGFYKAGSISQRQNNPGDLRSWGSYPVVNGYVQFPDAATGWAALNQQVQLNINRGLTLEEFFGGKPGIYGGYAPAADSNQPSVYAQFVGTQAGIPVDVPLNQIGGGISGPLPPVYQDTSTDPPAFDLMSLFGDPSNADHSESGVVDWGSLLVLGVVGLVLYMAFSD